MIEIKRVLFPVDFTENSSRILPYALTVSAKFGATIYLLHVVEDFSKWTGGFYIPGVSIDLYRKEALSAAEKTIEKTSEQLHGYLQFKKKIVFGDPIQEILKTIESEAIDLVVMGTHGRKGLEHVVFGSVAENVVKKSPAPVLTINPYKTK
ncbi:MAG: universal stress protein [Deltaproteobacteria bacterium]|nr:universal stress protein [Deltaproteobacteria bacterium]